MNYRILTLVLLFLSGCKVTDVNNSSLENGNYNININTQMVTLDPLNNILVTDDRDNLHRYSDSGIEYLYADNTLGRISHIDASDPLKILIYRKEYNTATILDNTLSELEHINLSDNGYNDISSIAISNEGYLWIYDVTDYRLKKIRRDGSLILESSSLLDYRLQDINPSFILERNGKVVLQDHNKGIYLFDNLGQYIQVFPFKTNNFIQFDGVSICYYDGGQFSCYHTKLYEEKNFDIPENKKAGLLDVKAGDNSFYLIYKEGIDIIPIRS